MTIIVQPARYPKNVEGWIRLQMNGWGTDGAELVPAKKFADGTLNCINVRKPTQNLDLGRAVSMECLGAGIVELRLGGMPEDVPAFDAFVSSASRIR